MTKKDKTLFEALQEFNDKCPNLPKDASGYGYSYCQFSTMIGIISPILQDVGLQVRQSTVTIDGSLYMKTTVSNNAGETHESLCPMIIQGTAPSKKQLADGIYPQGHVIPPGMQQVGATVTYARRYGIGMALNLVTDDDSDCAVVRISRYNHKALLSALKDHPKRDDVVVKIFEENNIDALENLPASVFDRTMKRIREKRPASPPPKATVQQIKPKLILPSQVAKLEEMLLDKPEARAALVKGWGGKIENIREDAYANILSWVDGETK